MPRRVSLVLALGTALLAYVGLPSVAAPAPPSAQVASGGAQWYVPLVARSEAPRKLDLALRFSETVQPEGDIRQLAVAFHSVEYIDANARKLGGLTFGTPQANVLQGEGWYDNETWPDVGAYQWAGGAAKRASIRLSAPPGTEGLLLHVTSVQNAMWMTATVDGRVAATLRVDGFLPSGERYWHDGYVPVSAPIPEPGGSDAPQWTEGRYFPHFPATDGVYALRVRTTFAEDYAATWDPQWRINRSHDDMMALTLVGMQGVINRSGPRVYLDWHTPWATGGPWSQSDPWIHVLSQHARVVYLDLDGLSAMSFLMRRYASRFAGAVVYDPQVADTINLATMLAGLEDRIMLAPEQLALPGIEQTLQGLEERFTPAQNPLSLPTLPRFQCVTDLRQLAQEQGWQPTEQGQTQLYQWVYDNLWPRLEHRMIGVTSPGPPASREGLPGSYWPLEMASRDVVVALRLPAIYLSPVDEPQLGLFARFLEDAPSPILITGGVAGYEEETTALASRYGDWQAVLSWPGEPLTVGSLTVFSGVRPELKPYRPEMHPDRILATLGDHPVATMFSTDGDAIFFQMRRGFEPWFVWEKVQNQRFGWTINPTVSELAPLVWNYYVQSRAEVSLLTGLSGAGYAYPQLMSGEQLDGYLAYTARYLDDTGLRVVRVDERKGPWTEELAAHYYQALHDAGYLGAIVGYGGGLGGLGFDYSGVPAPAVWPAYALRGQNEAGIVAHILSRDPGQEFIDVDAGYIVSPDTHTIEDADAYAGRAALVPSEFVSSPSCCLAVTSHGLTLPAGHYTATFRVKVAANGGADPFAAVYVGHTPTEWHPLVYQSIAPSDFDQPNQYQDFTVSFALEHLTREVEMRIDYFRGATPLYIDTLRAVRTEGPVMPVFATVLVPLMLAPSEFEYQPRAPERFREAFESAGGVVLTPDEFLAALNPEFMIEFATPRLGAGHPALAEAQQLLDEERFLESLLAVREGLKGTQQEVVMLMNGVPTARVPSQRGGSPDPRSAQGRPSVDLWASLAGAERIETPHLAETIQYRPRGQVCYAPRLGL